MIYDRPLLSQACVPPLHRGQDYETNAPTGQRVRQGGPRDLERTIKGKCFAKETFRTGLKVRPRRRGGGGHRQETLH